MASPGILYVTMQPHPDLNLAQFHEWYNNEHGPTRLSIPSIFSNGLRFRRTTSTAASGTPPTPDFMAVYDVHHMPLLATPTYTALRTNRSPREAATIARVDVRRAFYDLIHTSAASTFRPIEALSDAEAAHIVTVAVEITLTEDPAAACEYRRWYEEEHVGLLARVPGWLRSRLFKTSALDDNSETRYFCLHDYEPRNGLGGPEHAASMDTPRRAAVFDTYVAAKTRHTYSLFYVFGAAPRDLHSLSQLPPSSSSSSFTDHRTTTTPTPVSISSRITAAGGIALPYRLEGSPAPEAPTVVLCNSLLTSLTMWDPLVAILKARRPDLRILRYDARGRHAAPPLAATLADHAADLEALRAALRIDRYACVAGVSMGGATALCYALTHPARVGRLLAADFNCASSPANTQSWRDRIAVARDGEAGMARLAEQTVTRWFHRDASRETAAWMRTVVAGNDVEGFANSCTALWDYDMRAEMRACAVPALLVAGEADGGGALVTAMEGFKGLLGEGGAELRVVKGAGHLPMCENPEGFWGAIKDFI
ncbi:Dimeric alpha-beta barrel [Cordyceps fumosorosea ARSEF 2679]|uniref:Dimeric alpha-beta barrel n=1 Tax=Cordyceps fumosorosea (strain ARSEF 2679) TaxID=1081104 RepID=A0A167QPM2_CORFA|nr:Dimeric alpha-beta barrel [Cordyceps fumosorosea ARSEF 2679]OAA57830.1 Dimeric alpha-beta barrel [Cordyceps fumosorosea ARSEF 2679]